MWIICHGEEGGVCTGAAGDSGRGVCGSTMGNPRGGRLGRDRKV